MPRGRKKKVVESESEDEFVDSEEDVQPKKKAKRPRKGRGISVLDPPPQQDDYNELSEDVMREELIKRNFYPPMVKFFDRNQLLALLNEKQYIANNSFIGPNPFKVTGFAPITKTEIMMENGVLSTLNQSLLNHSITQTQISCLPDDVKSKINIAYNTGETTDEIVKKYIRPVLNN